jgi:hypothetical protein
MLIEVIRKGYTEGVVEDHLLAKLIDSNKIIASGVSAGGPLSVRTRFG